MFGRVYDHHESKNGLSAIFRPLSPQNAKVTKNDKNEFSGQKNHIDHMRITILHQIWQNDRIWMTASDGKHKSTDMRELGHFTHTQWNLEPYRYHLPIANVVPIWKLEP